MKNPFLVMLSDKVLNEYIKNLKINTDMVGNHTNKQKGHLKAELSEALEEKESRKTSG